VVQFLIKSKYLFTYTSGEKFSLKTFLTELLDISGIDRIIFKNNFFSKRSKIKLLLTFPTISGIPPTLVPITGVPTENASRATKGAFSGHIEGTINAKELAYRLVRKCLLLIWPKSWILSWQLLCTIISCNLFSNEPVPTIRSFRSGALDQSHS